MVVEDILEALAARQALESTPEPWLDAARGVISTEEAARRVLGQEDPELVERSMALFAPGDAEADERRLQLLLDGGFPAPRRWWRGTVGLGLALAAALVLVLSLPRSGALDPGGPTLSTFELVLEQGARLDRAAQPAAAPEVTRYYADRSFRAMLRPWDPIDAELEAAVLVCEDSGPRRLPVTPRVLRNGVVVVEGDVASLGLAVGSWRLLFVVGTVGSLPSPKTCDADELAAIDGAQVIQARIEILPPPR